MISNVDVYIYYDGKKFVSENISFLSIVFSFYCKFTYCFYDVRFVVLLPAISPD